MWNLMLLILSKLVKDMLWQHKLLLTEGFMKKMSLWLCSLFLLAGVTAAQAEDVGVQLNINVGNAPGVVIAEPPIFIAPPALGFYVAIGVPYDLFYFDFHYYLCRGNTWYYATGYNGPWIVVRYEKLPWGLRRHKYNRIITIRDEEFKRYNHNHGHYDGYYFRPGRHEQREERHEKHDKWGKRQGQKHH